MRPGHVQMTMTMMWTTAFVQPSAGSRTASRPPSAVRRRGPSRHEGCQRRRRGMTVIRAKARNMLAEDDGEIVSVHFILYIYIYTTKYTGPRDGVYNFPAIGLLAAVQS